MSEIKAGEPERDSGRDPGREASDAAEEMAALRARASELERQLQERSVEAEARIVRSELKSEAMRAGMIDLDGLKLIDVGQVKLDEHGNVAGGASLMAKLRRDKPWLFASASSSSVASAPPSQPVKPRLATEMSLEEWRAARSELLRRR